MLSGTIVFHLRDVPQIHTYNKTMVIIVLFHPFRTNRISNDLYPRIESRTVDAIDHQLNDSRFTLSELLNMLDRRSVDRHYENAMKGLCDGTLLGLSIMTVAALVTAFLLTLLVCVDSHTWIYLSQK